MSKPEQDVVLLPPTGDALHPWLALWVGGAAVVAFAISAMTFDMHWWGWPAAVTMLTAALGGTWLQGGGTRCELHPAAVVIKHRLRADERIPLSLIERIVTCRPQTSTPVLQFGDGSGARLPVAPQDRWGTPAPAMIARWLDLHGHPGTGSPGRVRITGDWPWWACLALGQASIIWLLTSFTSTNDWGSGVSWSLMAIIFFLSRTIPDLRGRRVWHDWSADPDGPPPPLVACWDDEA